MAENVTQKLVSAHLVEGDMKPGAEIGIRIDQTLTQDATGTLVMLEFEAMGIGRVKTEISAQYVDHSLLQTDFRNPDDHLFLQSACRKFGIWYSRPGMTLLGADSLTPAAGSLGMLAIGAANISRNCWPTRARTTTSMKKSICPNSDR